jgi:hypothetical protein
MKTLFKKKSILHNSHYMNRRKKNRLWIVLIPLLAVAGYFAVPKIIKSISKAEPDSASQTESEQAAEEKIIKTIPLPDLESQGSS